jgi:hypothetical protein
MKMGEPRRAALPQAKVVVGKLAALYPGGRDRRQCLSRVL